MIVFLLWGAPKKFSNFNVGETVCRVFWQDIANLPISAWQKCIQHEGNHQLVLLRTPLDLHGLLAGSKTIYLKEFDHMIHQPEIIWVWMIAKRSAAEVFCVFAFHAKLSRTMLSREWWVLKSEKSKSRRPAVRHCRRPAVLATSAQALQPGHMLHCPQEASCLRCSRWHCWSTGACICRLHTSGNVRDKQLGRPHLIARELSIRPSSHILMGSKLSPFKFLWTYSTASTSWYKASWGRLHKLQYSLSNEFGAASYANHTQWKRSLCVESIYFSTQHCINQWILCCK